MLLTQLIFFYAGNFHQMPQQADFQRRICVDGDRNARILSRFGINMVTALDSFQFPTLFFDKLAEFLSAYSFQTAISITLSFSDTEISSTSTDKHPSTAS